MQSLLLRRAGSRRLLLGALALLASAATALVALTIAGAGVTATQASRAAIDAQLGGAPVWEIRTRIAPDPLRQDEVVRATVASNTEGITTEVGRFLITEARVVTIDGTTSRRGLASINETSLVVDGEWPGQGEVLAHAELGVAPGTRIDIAGTTYTVSGSWTRAEPAMPGTPAPMPGEEPLVVVDEAALLGVDDASFVFWDVRVDPSGLDIEALTELATVGARLEAAIRAADGVAIRGLNVTDNLETGGGQLATVLQASNATASAVSLAPAGFLVAVAALAILQLLKLISLTRDVETRVLLARGAGRARIVRSAAVEAALVGTVGAALGAVVTIGVLLGQPGGSQQTPTVLATAIGVILWTVAAAVAVALTAGEGASVRAGRVRRAVTGGAVVVVGALAILSGMRLYEIGTVVTETEAGTRADPLAVIALGAALLLGGLVVLALLPPATRAVETAATRTRGLSLVLAARQTARRLPHLVTLALLVSLAAGSVTVASAFTGTTEKQRWTDARMKAGSDVRLTLPGPLNAGTAHATTPDVAPFAAIPEADAAVVVRTAQAPVAGDEASLVALPVDRLGEILDTGTMETFDGVDTGVLVGEPGLAVIPAGAEELVVSMPLTLRFLEQAENPDYSLEFEVSGLVRLNTADGGVLPVPVSSQTITVGADGVEAGSGETEANSGVEAGSGETAANSGVEAGSGADAARREGAVALEFPVPPGAARVLSFDVQLTGITPERDNEQILAEQGIHWADPETGQINDEVFNEAMNELALDGIPDSTSSFVLELADPEVLADGAAITGPLVLPEQEPTSPITVQEDGTPWLYGNFSPWDTFEVSVRYPLNTAAAAPVPALVTRTLATALDLSEGSTLALALDGPTVTTRVVGVVEGVPGASDPMAALVDLPTLTAHLAATRSIVNGPNEIWIATGGDLDEVGAAAAAVAEAEQLEATVTLARPGQTDATAPIRATFWLAAAGALTLALIGAAAAAAGQNHGRDGELAALRALGQSSRRAARSRAGEVLAIALPSALLGVLIGWAAAALYIPHLSRTATAGIVSAPVTLDAVSLLASLAILLAGLVAVGAGIATAVRRRMSRVGVES